MQTEKILELLGALDPAQLAELINGAKKAPIPGIVILSHADGPVLSRATVRRTPTMRVETGGKILKINKLDFDPDTMVDLDAPKPEQPQAIAQPVSNARHEQSKKKNKQQHFRS